MRNSRRILAVTSALLCVAIIPSFAQGGGIVGIAVSNRAYFYAYLILGWIVSGLLTIGLVVFVPVSVNDSLTFAATLVQGVGLVLCLTLFISLLPSMVVAWSDPEEKNIDLGGGV